MNRLAYPLIALAISATATPASAQKRADPPLSGTVLGLAKRCSPNVHPLTMGYLATAESANNPFAVGVNGGARLPRQPANVEEAAATVKWLQARGYNFDVGYAQVNSSNFDRLGVTGVGLLDGCTNLRASATVLTGCYAEAVKSSGEGQAALQRALSCYNTGSQTAGFANGYVAKVVKVAGKADVLQIPALLGDAKSAPVPAASAAGTDGQGAASTAAPQPENTSSNSDSESDVFGQADDDAFAHADPGAFHSEKQAQESSNASVSNPAKTTGGPIQR